MRVSTTMTSTLHRTPLCAALLTASIAATLPAAAAPSAHAEAAAQISWDGGYGYNWGGWAVGLNRTWTYTFYFRLRASNGTLISAPAPHRGWTGGSSYSRSFHSSFDPVVHGWSACARFEIRHGTTDSSPLVANPLECYPQWSLTGPPPAQDESTAPAAPTDTTTTPAAASTMDRGPSGDMQTSTAPATETGSTPEP